MFLSKRFYMGKDVIEDSYGRLYHFPRSLVGHGHSVSCLVSDYHLKTSEAIRQEVEGIDWVSFPILTPRQLYREAKRLAAKSDVIVASSDCIQVALGGHLARKYRKPYVADLYDNYESFGLSRIPGVASFYRKALETANLVTCVGEELAEYVRCDYGLNGQAVALNSSIPSGQFYPTDKRRAREALGLPSEGRLVGICGGLTRNRGIGYFYSAVEELLGEGVNLKLVLAGGLEKGSPPPSGENVILLGNLPFNRMNDFYNAMDVNVMQYVDNAFGRYCYPQKLEEITATRACVVASDVGEMRRRFRATPALLYRPDDTASIKETLVNQLENRVSYEPKLQSWMDVGRQLDSLLRQITG